MAYIAKKKLNHYITYYWKLFYKVLVSLFPSAKKMWMWKELWLLFFFSLLFFIVILRVFYLQVVKWNYYDQLLTNIHSSVSELVAQRGHIYVTDSSDKPTKLTENITLYNLFVDPDHISDKNKFIEIMTPIIYYHLCVLNGFDKPDNITCIKNIEDFTKKDLLPKAPDVFYYGSWIYSEEYTTFNRTGYNQELDSIISSFSWNQAYSLISEKLHDRIRIWFREYNPLWFFDNEVIVKLKELNLPYVSIQYGNYVYIQPDLVKDVNKAENLLIPLFESFWYNSTVEYLPSSLVQQKYRYVRIFTNANPIIAQQVKQLKILDFYRDKHDKETYLNEISLGDNLISKMRKSLENIYSLDYNDQVKYKYRNSHIASWFTYIVAPNRELYWVGLEPYTKRYYPFWHFMSNVIWYINDEGLPFHGIEEYFWELLKWSNWKITWRASSWIWQIWANDFQIDEVKHWKDIYITVDPSIQKQVEDVIERYQKEFRADSISVLVYDPFSWKVISSANYPDFDPNTYYQAYWLRPLTVNDEVFLDNDTYLDVPVFISSGDVLRKATTDERSDLTLKKYISNNIYGPVSFADKNIAYSYEPGSIFKAFTYAVGLDVDEISMYDMYDDPNNRIQVWPYVIKNADANCQWTHNFLYALQYSCNVWMVRIAQKLTKFVFYNYINKLGFWQYTNIELWWEDKWFVEAVNKTSDARFFNNAFGQWLLATPLQIAAAYGSLVNGWYYIKPTILDKICDDKWCEVNQPKVLRRVFADDINEKMRSSLITVLDNPSNKKFAYLTWYALWWKSWTSQIAYKWKYKQWNWWTNTSFVWIVTEDNLKYVVVVQVRRPRSTQRWAETAWKVFRDVAEFLVGYELIEKKQEVETVDMNNI